MQYQAFLKSFSYEWYEGTLCLEIGGTPFAVAYTVNCDEFVEKHLKAGAQILVDLWLRYCTKVEILPPNAPKCFPCKQNKSCEAVQGQVVSVFGPDLFRLDCGTILIDVKNEEGIAPQVGQMVKARGSYHVFFPGTECSYENLELL